MLRFVVLMLLLANAAFYAWSQGALRDWGLAPMAESEPQRMGQQIAPEALRIVPGEGAAPAPASPPEGLGNAAPEVPAAPAAPVEAVSSSTAAARGECLQAGPFDTAQADAWRSAARALPQGSWSLEGSTAPGRWMVYMGRFADADALAKKRTELRTRNVAFDKPGSPALEPGLSLGRFSSEEAAQRALAALTQQGVRSARVVVERAETTTFTLRLPLVDAALRAQLDTLHAALAGKALRPCF